MTSTPVVPPPAARASADRGWKFDYHGYFRAPLRVGLGKRLPEDTNGYLVVDGDGDPYTATLHEATVPDDQYLSFQSTAHNMRAWAEAFFSFGNELATGTLGIGSYNLTESGFSDPDAQWGISQAYVTLTPDLGYENVRLRAKAGAIVDKYGMAGRYDAGEYDTYAFGRTHVMGETVRVDYDLSGEWTLSLEQGIGTHEPDPNAYNNARYTLLHHEHLGLNRGRELQFGAHYLMAWSQEEYRPNRGVTSTSDGAPRNGLPTGTQWVAGVEARAELGPFGYLYGAYTHVGAKYALTVSRAIEVLHATGGGEFDLGIASNYLDSPACHDLKHTYSFPSSAPQNWTPLDPDGCSDGNGSIDALLAQYELSFTNLREQLAGGPRFWGRGFDVILKLYGMLAFVRSEARDTSAVAPSGSLTEAPDGYRVTKSKFGADVAVPLLPWLTPALRFDRVMPNSRIPEQSFAILSPRIAFQSEWLTRERITLGYSRYFYDQRVCEPGRVPNGSGGTMPNPDPLYAHRCAQPPPSPVPYDGFGSNTDKQDDATRASGVTRPDENVFKLEATMWW